MKKTHKKQALGDELSYLASRGYTSVSVKEMTQAFAELGYTLDRDSDFRHSSYALIGWRKGKSYPACSTGLIETDTRMRAFNRNARRDDNFDKMQELRKTCFAISRGHILTV